MGCRPGGTGCSVRRAGAAPRHLHELVRRSGLAALRGHPDRRGETTLLPGASAGNQPGKPSSTARIGEAHTACSSAAHSRSSNHALVAYSPSARSFASGMRRRLPAAPLMSCQKARPLIIAWRTWSIKPEAAMPLHIARGLLRIDTFDAWHMLPFTLQRSWAYTETAMWWHSCDHARSGRGTAERCSTNTTGLAPAVPNVLTGERRSQNIPLFRLYYTGRDT